MGFVGNVVSDLTGIGSAKGSGWNAQTAKLLQPATLDQANEGYNQAQSGLNQQQNFVNALMGSNAMGGQNALAQQLQGIANGTGPNPALQQLQNTTGQNVANQAALMAGQRGSGSNAGLLARQIGQQGAQIQQQATGQGAALQADQQLNAMNALQNLYGQQVGQQSTALSGYNQTAQNQYGQLLGALSNYNQAQVGNVGQANSANSNVQKQVAGNQAGFLNNVIGGGLQGAGATKVASAFLGLANGGMVGPTSQVGKYFAGMASGGMARKVPGKAEVSGDSLKNDKVPAMLSPGEIVLPRSVIQSSNPVEKSAKFVEAILRRGGK